MFSIRCLLGPFTCTYIRWHCGAAATLPATRRRRPACESVASVRRPSRDPGSKADDADANGLNTINHTAGNIICLITGNTDTCSSSSVGAPPVATPSRLPSPQHSPSPHPAPTNTSLVPLFLSAHIDFPLEWSPRGFDVVRGHTFWDIR